MGFAEGPQPALDQRGIGQNPAVQGGVVDLEAALEEQLLDVTVAERIAQIPGDRLQDQRGLVVAAFEIVLGPPLQLLDKGVQDHRPPPVRRRIWRPHAQRGVNAKTLRRPPVKWFNEQRGYGFIQPDQGGRNVFVHISAVERSGMRGLAEGQKVSYDVEADRRSGKESATNLRSA